MQDKVGRMRNTACQKPLAELLVRTEDGKDQRDVSHLGDFASYHLTVVHKFRFHKTFHLIKEIQSVTGLHCK